MLEGGESAAALAAAQFAGGVLMFMAPVLFVVRWNTINGKAGALGCWIAAANSAAIALKMDSNVFVPRGWCVLCSFCCWLC